MSLLIDLAQMASWWLVMTHYKYRRKQQFWQTATFGRQNKKEVLVKNQMIGILSIWVKLKWSMAYSKYSINTCRLTEKRIQMADILNEIKHKKIVQLLATFCFFFDWVAKWRLTIPTSRFGSFSTQNLWVL